MIKVTSGIVGSNKVYIVNLGQEFTAKIDMFSLLRSSDKKNVVIKIIKEALINSLDDNEILLAIQNSYGDK